MQALTYCDAKVMSTRTATGQFKVSSRGRWMKVQGRFKMQALTYCDAIVMSTRITAGQFKGQFMGAMDEMSRKVQSAKAHSNLRTRKAALRQFSGAMEEMSQKVQGRWRKCLGRFKMQALTHWDAKITSTCTAVGQFKGQFKGAMEDMSGKVQNANTHILRRQNHEHAHSSRSVQGSSMGQRMKCRKRFEMQTLTFCDAKITRTHTATGQSKGQFKGASTHK